MLTLRQSKLVQGSAGEALPTVFQNLDEKGAQFRRGQLSLLAAAPGTGKSALVLTQALRSKVPCFYFSADSGSDVVRERALAIANGCSVEEAREANRREGYSKLEKALDDIPIRFLYDPSPSLGVIEANLEAYEEIYGEFPAMTVIDNVTNVRSGFDGGSDDPFGGLEPLMDYLHSMARYADSAVIGLHHVQGAYNDGDQPIPLSGVKGQITRVPELVLTSHRGFDGQFINVSVVKNRNGRSWPNGVPYAELRFDGEYMRITDI